MEARRMQVSRVIFAAQDTGEPVSASPSGDAPVKWCGEPGFTRESGSISSLTAIPQKPLCSRLHDADSRAKRGFQALCSCLTWPTRRDWASSRRT